MESHENIHAKLNEDFLKEYSAEENIRRYMKKNRWARNQLPAGA